MSPKRPEKFRGFYKTKKMVNQTLEFIYKYEKRPLSSLNNSLPELEKQKVDLVQGIRDNKDNPTVRSVLEFKLGLLDKRIKGMKSGKISPRKGSRLDKDSREGKNLVDDLKTQLQEVLKTLSEMEERDKTWTENDFLGVRR
jgi:hypothetical protein